MPMGWTNSISRRRLQKRKRFDNGLFQLSKKRRKFSPKAIGHAWGYDTSKRYQIQDVSAGLYSTRTLYSVDITNIPETTTGENHKRDRDMINLQGFKLTQILRNELAQPAMFHLAVVSPKNNSVVDTQNFFRGNNVDRGEDFSTAKSGFDLNFWNINTDNFVILMHKRYNMTQNGNNASWFSLEGKNYFSLKKWIPCKRQIRYQDGVACEKIFLVFWMDYLFASAGTAAAANAATMSQRVVVFFREPK